MSTPGPALLAIIAATAMIVTGNAEILIGAAIIGGFIVWLKTGEAPHLTWKHHGPATQQQRTATICGKHHRKQQ